MCESTARRRQPTEKKWRKTYKLITDYYYYFFFHLFFLMRRKHLWVLWLEYCLKLRTNQCPLCVIEWVAVPVKTHRLEFIVVVVVVVVVWRLKIFTFFYFMVESNNNFFVLVFISHSRWIRLCHQTMTRRFVSSLLSVLYICVLYICR